MSKNKLPQGLRKYIRNQKMLIRHRIKSQKEADKLVKELIEKFHKGAK